MAEMAMLDLAQRKKKRPRQSPASADMDAKEEDEEAQEEGEKEGEAGPSQRDHQLSSVDSAGSSLGAYVEIQATFSNI